LEAIHRLWDDLADFPGGDRSGALEHLLTTVAALVKADNVWWLGTVRVGEGEDSPPHEQWRPSAIHYLYPSPLDHGFYRIADQELARRTVDESVAANLRGVGTFRVNWLPELVSPGWYDSQYYRLGYESRGIRDAIFVCCPINRDVEVVFGFHRKGPPESRFQLRDKEVLGHALRGLRWFHRQLLLEYGLLVATDPLTETERRVLRPLLTRMSEREIAESVSLARPTVHNHITAIYRKFGVKSRAGLMSLWLGGRL
jgi:DNA-binding CsgD family transcriptional regulator